MASWVLAHPPWQTLARVRLRWDVLVKSGTWTSKQFLSTPTLAMETPAMREVKAYPYPVAAPDASLFEETTDEYHEAASDAHLDTGLYPLHVAVDHPSMMLKNLVKAGQYSDAARVHSELLDMGVEIPPHPVYHFAARQALHDAALPQRERLETFAKWWSLVPLRAEVDEARRVVNSVLAELLRNDATPDIPLVIRFALLAASKGFARDVADDVVPVVARYAPSQVFLRFLEEFCAAAQNFDKTATNGGGSPQATTEHIPSSDLTSWYRSAMKELALAGKTHTAVQVLQTARSRDIHVSRKTYAVLLRRLRHESATEDLAAVQGHFDKQWGDRDWLETRGKKATLTPSEDPRHAHIPPADLSQEPTEHAVPSDPVASELQAMVTIARTLKHAIPTGNVLWPAATLSEVITLFVKADRSTLLRRLRARAYQHTKLVLHWALAEMMHHDARRHSLNAIMKVFESHFHVVGVPRGFADEAWTQRSGVRSKGIALWRPYIRRKLAPSRAHTLFVWGVYLSRATTRTQARRLYVQLLEDVAASRDVPASAVPHLAALPGWEPTTNPEEYLDAVPPPSLFDTAHFALFMKAFQRLEVPTRAGRVMVDMYALGIRPDGAVFLPFVYSLLFPPSEGAATVVLDFYEKEIENADALAPSVGQPQTQADSPLPPGRCAQRDALKTETLAFIYAGVMRRLLTDGREAEAQQVAQRFAARVPYSQGTNTAVDNVLRMPAIASVVWS